ncbi:MAG: GGDEF domain-containing protein [Gammaproteobacteria bacterium]|jgi:diguanylate cyclase|nr:GGDEF domain-containing protein [Gammaproteobacteria bacterium]MBT3724977.1 GGDEF domain-containing protein [Gammaproteobacteria bacterium]MBT4077921.1 GGDEF domain-containing protein [Gammaproteobacteria bacterium]MBT4192770.1 GGDEF domain-containing protein [Gammaproteobacteria bacterium]MBT4451914.1 GGDEF domain-containing protein [Gammaproteobacteria bacterium]
MSNSSKIDKKTNDSAAELFRLSLTRLGKLRLSITPVNYSLIYFYLSGDNLALNEKLDELFLDIEKWNDEKAEKLFNRYICNCKPDEKENEKLRQELLSTVANILGMLIDLGGKTAVSNESLEMHMEKLAVSKDPSEVLHIASNIISETRIFVDETKKFETTLSDISNVIETLKNELDDARRQATIDALTGLNNRRIFDDVLVTAINSSQSSQEPFCLLLLDIDKFKDINDNYGHIVGDKVLVGLSKVLRKHMRGSDYLCRYGGEEFAVVITETLITGAFTVAEKLRKSIENLRLKHVKTGQQIGQVTISIGVASYRNGESSIELVERCDSALYRAKSLGRNRTVIAD